jgi:serine/threonine protein phosphatase 1
MKTFVVGDVHGRRAQLEALLKMLPRDEAADTLVFLGDFIDRGPDAPGVVREVIELQRAQPSRVITLRGNHEQMLLDFVDDGTPLWLAPQSGGERTYQQYTGMAPAWKKEEQLENTREQFLKMFPPEHLEFLRSLQLFYEDDYALYVHAGLDQGKHPCETDEYSLLWSRDMDFYKNYRGKPCLFGHTPTTFLPLRGRLGRHGIYIFHSAVGIDTGYNYHSPLSCLELPEFKLYQSFADGHTAQHHITNFIPETLRAMRKVSQNNLAKAHKIENA